MSFPKTLLGLWLVPMLAAVPGAGADEPPAVRADFGYASRHVFRGIERAGPSAQGGVELTRENFRGGVWTNRPLAGGEIRETNLRAGYTWQTAGALSLEAAVSHTWFNGVPGGEVKQSFEGALTASWAPVNGFTPSLSYSHDLRLRAESLQCALARSIALTRLGAFLELNVYAGWVTGDNWRPDAPGPARHDSYSHWGAEAYLPYNLGPILSHSTLLAGLHYADAIGRSKTNGPIGRLARHNLWITLGVNLDF